MEYSDIITSNAITTIVIVDDVSKEDSFISEIETIEIQSNNLDNFQESTKIYENDPSYIDESSISCMDLYETSCGVSYKNFIERIKKGQFKSNNCDASLEFYNLNVSIRFADFSGTINISRDYRHAYCEKYKMKNFLDGKYDNISIDTTGSGYSIWGLFRSDDGLLFVYYYTMDDLPKYSFIEIGIEYISMYIELIDVPEPVYKTSIDSMFSNNTFNFDPTKIQPHKYEANDAKNLNNLTEILNRIKSVSNMN